MSFKALYDKMRRLRVDEALWVLDVYNYLYDDISFRCTWTTPNELRFIVGNKRSACSVGIEFWGGAPGNRAIYYGDLSTFVVDRVLQAWVIKKINWTWLLRFNASTIAHIKTQLESYIPTDKQQTLFDIHDEIRHQGRVVKRSGETIPIRAHSGAATDDGKVYLWSSSNRTHVCKREC